MQSIDERGGELQNELNLMGDDIGQIIEASGASELQRQVFTARDAEDLQDWTAEPRSCRSTLLRGLTQINLAEQRILR